MSVDKVEIANAQPLTSRPLVAKVRMTDLARSAGVSVATVSRSLNDSPLINRATKSRVWQVACDQGYVAAHHVPESLRDSGAAVAVMIAPDGMPHDILYGLVEAARDMRCTLTISHLGPHSHHDLAGALLRSGADAFVFPDTTGFEAAIDRVCASHRVIAWGEASPARAYATVGPDNFAGARLATAHLAAAGCRRIAYLGDTEGPGMMQRFMGYLTALNEAGLRVDPALVLREALSGDCDGVFIASPSRLAQGLTARCDMPVVAWHDGACALPVATVGVDMVAAGRIILQKLLSSSQISETLSVRLKTT